MDVVKYFEEHIKEELDGAIEYVKNAFVMKAMDPNWSKSFIDMATQELNHAGKLYGMFEQFYQNASKSMSEMPEYIDETRDNIIECYITKHSMVKNMIDLYSKG